MNFETLYKVYCRFVIIIIVSFGGAISAFAQYSISGPTSVYEGSYEYYTIVDQYNQYPSNYYNCNFTWYNSVGTMEGSSGYGVVSMDMSFYLVESGDISVDWEDNFTYDYYYVSIDVQVNPVPPATPLNPIVLSNDCNSTTLQHDTPPAGETWYWQTTADGISTSDANTTKTVTSGSTYYLRARNNSTLVWSTESSSITYTIDSPPVWYSDSDGDGFGDPNVSLIQCSQPANYVSNNFDACPSQTGNPLNNGCPGAGDSGSIDKNYIHTITPLIAVTNVSQITNVDDKIEEVTYFDGLGKSIQEVGIRAGGQKQDIKTPLVNDEFGRQTISYLSHASVTGAVSSYTTNTSLINDLNSYYVSKYPNQLNSGSPNTYSEKRFDKTPLNRVLENGTPGKDWLINPNNDNDHTTKFEYNSNTTGEVYSIFYTGVGQPLSIEYFYEEAQLFKNTVKNENWKSTDGKVNTKDVFTDKMGKKIAEFSYINESSTLKILKTYYVYDNSGNLVYVLTPKLFTNLGSDVIITTTHLNNLAFQYKYDSYNRQIEQKVPGKKQWEYMVYDQLDRPILTQDKNLRNSGKWLFIKYDAFGRTVYTGLYTSALDRTDLQAAVDSYISGNSSNLSNIESRTSSVSNIGGVSINYSNNAYPITGLEILTVNYYDDYNFTDSDKPATPSSILGQTVTTRTKGLSTSNWAKTIGNLSWSKNYSYYDEKGRSIYVYEKNYLGGYTDNKIKLDFSGKVENSTTEHKRLSSSSVLTIQDRFEYDHIERPKAHYQIVNSQTEELIAKNSYDELGQLTKKEIGGNNGTALQSLDYTYDIQGKLKALNDVDNMGNDLFAYTLNYETGEGSNFNTPQYNGNISQIVWKSAYNNIKKSYYYDFDNLNRLIKGRYGEGSGLTTNWQKFEVNITGYDHNGNITGLNRRGGSNGGIIDDLNYYYDTNNGNQLMKIVDGSGTDGFTNGTTANNEDYDYDENGNLVKDLNKNISLVEYNYLDRVSKVTFSDGSNIQFLYNALGAKLRMIYTPYGSSVTTIDYIGGFQYTNDILQFFSTPEGYVKYNPGNTTYSYVYTLKDYLGNNRLSFEKSGGSNNILSSTDYYPMGLTHYGEYIVNSDYNYKFQGKERLLANNYNMYDFGSRMYDPSVGRWFNTDPQNQFQSPYLAMGNNWVIATDPNGEIVPLAVIAGAAIIGGVLNVAANWDRTDNFWEGLGHFATGAGSGVASVTLGPGGYAGASALGGALDEAIEGGNPGQIIRGAVQSGVGATIGLGVGKYMSKYGSVAINKLNVNSPILKGAIGGSVGGSIGGGITGGLFSSFDGGNFGDGFWKGVKTGAVYGSIGGAGQSIANSYADHINFLTGKPIGIDKTTITKDGINKVKQHLSRPSLDYDKANDVMIQRLESILDGKTSATKTDLRFYTHEIREMYLMKNGMEYNAAHQKSLFDYGIDYKKGFQNLLYTSEALRIGDEYFLNKN